MLGKPLARAEDILVQESGNELLIYDLKMNKAFWLNETSALVWQLCNGRNTVSEMSDEISENLRTLVGEDLVWLALDQFSKDGLLNDDEIVVRHFAGVSRREIIRKFGIGSVIALPIVSSIIAPKAISAQSGSCFPSGTCIMAGQNLCPPGCRGAIPVDVHFTTDGSCGPVQTSIFLICNGIFSTYSQDISIV